MAELVENFKANAIPNVQIPLSDDDDDHKNIAAVNTGFVRDLWIEDDEDGEAKLVRQDGFHRARGARQGSARHRRRCLLWRSVGVQLARQEVRCRA